MDPKDYEINPDNDIDLDSEVVYPRNGERMTNVKAQEMADQAAGGHAQGSRCLTITPRARGAAAQCASPTSVAAPAAP
jgi:hypothetical protein